MFLFFCDLPQPIKKNPSSSVTVIFCKDIFYSSLENFQSLNGLLYNTANTTSHVDTSRLLMMHENYSKKKN